MEPKVDQIKAALRLCAVDAPAGEYPCEKCCLYPFSKDGRMSTGQTCFEHLALDACQMIDRLNDFDQTQSKIALDRCQRAETRIAELEAQLAESQRRERAAVEDMREAALEQTGIGLCVVCKWGPEEEFDGPHCGKCTAGDCKFEWRGPQEAGHA